MIAPSAIRRPNFPFRKAMRFFSGKHSMYCLKKEVCVNFRNGTAALITPEFPGSTHDIMLLRSHLNELRELLGEKTVLADLGYRGVQHELPNIVVCGEEDAVLRARRVIVECFFGRLKTLFVIFSVVWPMKEEFFDTFFDVACALTNLDVLHRPLQEFDAEFNRGVQALVMAEVANRAHSQRVANTAFRDRRRARLGFHEDETVGEL